MKQLMVLWLGAVACSAPLSTEDLVTQDVRIRPHTPDAPAQVRVVASAEAMLVEENRDTLVQISGQTTMFNTLHTTYAGVQTVMLLRPPGAGMQAYCGTSVRLPVNEVTEVVTGTLVFGGDTRIVGYDDAASVLALECGDGLEGAGGVARLLRRTQFAMLPGRYSVRWGFDNMDGIAVEVRPGEVSFVRPVRQAHDSQRRLFAIYPSSRALPSACGSEVAVLENKGRRYALDVSREGRVRNFGLRADLDVTDHAWSYSNAALQLKHPMAMPEIGNETTLLLGRIDVEHVVGPTGTLRGTYNVEALDAEGQLTPVLADGCTPATGTGVDLPVGNYRVTVSYTHPTLGALRDAYDVDVRYE